MGYDLRPFEGRAERCETAGGLPHHPRRGCGHANYIDVPCPELDNYDQSKKQKPPLGKVTVSRFCFEILTKPG